MPRSSTSRIFKKNLAGTALAGTLCLSLSTPAALADTLTVVTSIKPLHSIASAVMEGVGTPQILIDGGASPHGFALKPSQALLLESADAVFWIGPDLAPSLEKPIGSMAAQDGVVALMEADGIEHLGLREGANFDAHDHDHGDAHHDEHEDEEEHAGHAHEGHDHDEDEHDEAGHDHGDADKHEHHDEHESGEEHAEHAHDDHGHDEDGHDEAGHDHGDADEHEHHDEHEGGEEHAEHAHDDHGHDEHAHDESGHGAHEDGPKDVHIWLNPDNGIAIAGILAEKLSALDPSNADIYKANAAQFADRIEKLEHEIEADLEPVAGKKFIVFHDGYHHFEHHFGIEASGAITLSPEALASADRIADIRDRIKDLDVTCVFQEPQFEAKLVDVVLEGSNAHKGTLDPLGADLENGPDLYPQLLKGLATSLSECLSGRS